VDCATSRRLYLDIADRKFKIGVVANVTPWAKAFFIA
jgi:hypothetical protein